jgi:hypothetical protein
MQDGATPHFTSLLKHLMTRSRQTDCTVRKIIGLKSGIFLLPTDVTSHVYASVINDVIKLGGGRRISPIL